MIVGLFYAYSLLKIVTYKPSSVASGLQPCLLLPLLMLKLSPLVLTSKIVYWMESEKLLNYAAPFLQWHKRISQFRIPLLGTSTRKFWQSHTLKDMTMKTNVTICKLGRIWKKSFHLIFKSFKDFGIKTWNLFKDIEVFCKHCKGMNQFFKSFVLHLLVCMKRFWMHSFYTLLFHFWLKYEIKT